MSSVVLSASLAPSGEHREGSDDPDREDQPLACGGRRRSKRDLSTDLHVRDDPAYRTRRAINGWTRARPAAPAPAPPRPRRANPLQLARSEPLLQGGRGGGPTGAIRVEQQVGAGARRPADAVFAGAGEAGRRPATPSASVIETPVKPSRPRSSSVAIRPDCEAGSAPIEGRVARRGDHHQLAACRHEAR